MIRKHNHSVDELFKNKKSTRLRTIKQQYEITHLTQQKLLSFDIPYFNHTKVCFFNGTKLILKTDIPELIAKFRELKKDLLLLLNTSEHFSKLRTLELILVFEPITTQPTQKSGMPQKAETAFKNLANQVEDDQIKQAILYLLRKHHEE